MRSFYEFFAGGGMARAGLGDGWSCLFANDFDAKKGETYRLNYPADDVLRVDDVRKIKAKELPGQADLVWGSFPCQDLSLAGGGAGLKGERSGTFYPFWDIVKGLIADGRGPKVIALENVLGTLTSHSGRDFEAICKTFADAGYRYGALVINAALFVPQSRPRLFVIGVRADVAVDPGLLSPGPIAPFHTPALQRAFERVEKAALKHRIWWNVPGPERRNENFADLIEENPTSVRWHTTAERDQLIAMMSPVNRAKLEKAKTAGHRMVGGIYKRTRLDENGDKVQRAEVRFDDVAGCLRTPAGGSSRQVIIVVDGPKVRTRLISSRETARLMGLDEDYQLPKNYNEAYHLTGDGVAVHVVRHLAQHIFEPLTKAPIPTKAAA
ncbi:DNA cytosine methyltransferase [Phenylobacterium sp.]|uniref:DNA cytosine methyltransferase n=1 Tax=Phenylobacterium sp. TaxID=1871053 RepID=UPI003BA98AB0